MQRQKKYTSQHDRKEKGKFLFLLIYLYSLSLGLLAKEGVCEVGISTG